MFAESEIAFEYICIRYELGSELVEIYKDLIGRLHALDDHISPVHFVKNKHG